jgi:hypothetical protein
MLAAWIDQQRLGHGAPASGEEEVSAPNGQPANPDRAVKGRAPGLDPGARVRPMEAGFLGLSRVRNPELSERGKAQRSGSPVHGG